MATEGGDWEQVDPEKELEEGDRIRTYHCVQAPELFDHEIIAKLSIEAGKITGQLNDQTPECMEAEVLSTSLIDGQGVVVEGDECEFVYVVEMRITKLEGTCRGMTTSALGQFVIAALAAALVLGGIALVFHRAEKFIQSPGGEEIGKNVSTAALLFAAGWSFTQFAGDDEE